MTFILIVILGRIFWPALFKGAVVWPLVLAKKIVDFPRGIFIK